MSISSDEINYLVYRYLQENGFLHSAFAFAHESLVVKSTVSQVDIPPGALITFLQKGLEYIGIEEHINEDGSIQEFDTNISLLSPFICDAIATKEDRRFRQVKSNDNLQAVSSSTSQGHAPVIVPGAVVAHPSVVSLRQHGTDFVKHLSLTGHEGEVFMCMWSPIAKQVASGSSDGMCRLWNLMDLTDTQWSSPDKTELSLRTCILPHSEAKSDKNRDVTSIAWSPNGMFLATGCYDGTARIWDNAGHLKAELKDHAGPVFSLKWSKTGAHLLSGSYDKMAIVWSLATGTAVKKFLLHSAPVLDVDWKDGDVFATCSTDGTIVICSLSSPTTDALCKFTGHTDEVNTVCWSAGGEYVASCSDDSTAKIWTMEGLLHNLTGHTKEIYTVRWTPTGPGSANPDKPLLLCTASFDGTVKVWNAVSGDLAFNLRRHNQPVYSICSNGTGQLLATGSLGGHISIWDLHTGKLVAEMLGNGDTFDVSWSFDSSLLCACFSSGTLSVFQTEPWFNALLNSVQLIEDDARNSPMIASTDNIKNLTVKGSTEAAVPAVPTNGKHPLEAPANSPPKRSMLSPGKTGRSRTMSSGNATAVVADASASVDVKQESEQATALTGDAVSMEVDPAKDEAAHTDANIHENDDSMGDEIAEEPRDSNIDEGEMNSSEIAK